MRLWIGLLGLLGLACGGGSAPTTVARLPASLSPRVLLGLDDGSVLVFGHTGAAHTPLTERVAVAERVGPDGQTTRTRLGTGWVVAADAQGDRVWAVHATLQADGEGSDYALQASADGGVRFERIGPVPATSVTALRLGDDGAGWVLGADTLLWTGDGGESWQARTPPAFARGISQPLVATGREGLLLGGRGLHRTADGGASWVQLTDAEVTATDGRVVVGRAGEDLRVGRLDGDGVAWLGTWPGPALAAHAWSHGDRIRVVAGPLDGQAGRSLVLYTSVDDGVSAESTSLRRVGSTDAAVFNAVGHAVWLDQDGRLRRQRSGH